MKDIIFESGHKNCKYVRLDLHKPFSITISESFPQANIHQAAQEVVKD